MAYMVNNGTSGPLATGRQRQDVFGKASPSPFAPLPKVTGKTPNFTASLAKQLPATPALGKLEPLARTTSTPRRRRF